MGWWYLIKLYTYSSFTGTQPLSHWSYVTTKYGIIWEFFPKGGGRGSPIPKTGCKNVTQNVLCWVLAPMQFFDPWISSAMAMAMSIYRTLCVLLSMQMLARYKLRTIWQVSAEIIATCFKSNEFLPTLTEYLKNTFSFQQVWNSYHGKVCWKVKLYRQKYWCLSIK